MNLLITNAGIAAMVNAEQDGTLPVKIAYLGYGSGQYEPTAEQTELQSPIKTVETVSGGAVSDNVLHVTATDSSTDTYTVFELGVFLEDGTLFAVCSQNTPLLTKAVASRAIFTVDITLMNDVGSYVQVRDTNFYNPPATTEVLGVIELATEEEAIDGEDSERAITPATAHAIVDARLATNSDTITGELSDVMVTPASLSARTATVGRTGLVELATDDEAISGTDNARAVTPHALAAALGKYDKDPVHKTGNETIAGVKTFTSSPIVPTPAADDNSQKVATTAWVLKNVPLQDYLPLVGGKMLGPIKAGVDALISHSDDESALRIDGGTTWGSGASLVLYGKDEPSYKGMAKLRVSDGTNTKELTVKPDGTATWDGGFVSGGGVTFSKNTDGGAMVFRTSVGGINFRHTERNTGAFIDEADLMSGNWVRLLTSTQGGANPVGSVIAFAANSAPSGYILCNGAAVSRTTYAALFAVIGTTYGAGDGSTTFNLPNLTNRFIQGSGTAGTVKNAGLPNITGGFTHWDATITPYGNGAIYDNNTEASSKNGAKGQHTHTGYVAFDASRSSSIYGASTTVQPPALTMRYYIKY